MPDHLPVISLQEDSHTGTHSNLYIISLIKQDVDRNKRKMFGYVPLNVNHQIPDKETLQTCPECGRLSFEDQLESSC